MRRITTGLAAIALSLSLAACGAASGDDGVATLGGRQAGATASDGDGASKDPEEAFRAFAACMRKHGIDMPDPEVNDGGGVVFSAPTGAGPADGGTTGGSREEFDAAREACEPHLEGVVNGRDGQGPSEAEQEKMRERMLEHAQCMRDHGIDFPDPQFGEGGRASQTLGDGIDPNDPTFRDAMDECSEKAGMHEPGERSGSGGGGIVTEGRGL